MAQDNQLQNENEIDLHQELMTELNNKYAIIDYGTRLAKQELAEGYKYINISAIKSPYKRLKLLTISACLNDSGYMQSSENMLNVNTIRYTNMTYSFEDIENTIQENIDTIFDLAQQGEKGYQIIEELLNGGDSYETDIDKAITSENILLGYTKFRIDRADGVNYVGMYIEPTYEGKRLKVFKYKYHDPIRGPETSELLSYIHYNDDEISYEFIEKKILDNRPYLFRLIRDHEEDAIAMIEEFIEKASKVQNNESVSLH
ncbi:hypothetical protein [Francisella tularensis]|uniref:hypothetical protein n=1 Tax=Francisella tularensis TaxID=263 RepID=UPI001C0E924F|nr:hypothetical protein [Francisella tularensis]MBK2109070.1 hypothetical protein [Francisella tularensis subsp. novicida FSC595]